MGFVVVAVEVALLFVDERTNKGSGDEVTPFELFKVILNKKSP